MMHRSLLNLFCGAVLAAILAGCGPEDPPGQESPPAEPTATPPADEAATEDVHSLANPEAVSVKHLSLGLEVDFESRTLDGMATLKVERHDPTAEELILDTRNLEILGVTDTNGEALDWALGAADPNLGRALEISLPEGVQGVDVSYRTAPGASGLQWLEPVQTAGKVHPFLFTQAQAIHARSFVPIQDTPQVRFTYDAVIRPPRELRAVMSAANDPDAELDGEFHFEMPQPIPSYLLAFAVGHLDFQPMSERTGVYAEPELLAAAAYEFADTEAMMVETEALYGPYPWGRYDLLILPPSFPFGGMENPRLSFITPTVIAGDRSLVSLIAHELAHSWSGNLVTNASWEHLWLNEGFTTYLESRIMELVYGEERRRMEDVLGYQALQEDLEELPSRDQWLVADFEGRDPDEAFSWVPYEKGRLLLIYLENRFGRDVFDEFLRGYFDHFAFHSLTTETFLAYLDENLLANHPGQVTLDDVRGWLYAPGLPEDAVLPRSDAFTRVDTVRSEWLDGQLQAEDLPVAGWTVHEWLYFLNNLPEDLESDRLAELDAAHGLTGTANSEIAHSWLRQAIAHRYEPAMPRLRDYLSTIGRLKLISPLYEDLMETGWGTELAREVYADARPGYHPQAQATLDDIVE